ncbi:MAG: phaC PHA synthase [Psychromonas sp.]
MKKLLPVLTLAAAFVSPTLLANETPFMFSTIDGNNTPNASSVRGVRLTVLHGKVQQVTGVDFAAFGFSQTNTTIGANLNFFGAHKVSKSMTGASLGILNWQTGYTQGANIGPINVTNNMQGANIGAINVANNVEGANVGAINITNNVEGANVSFVNFSTGRTVVDVGALSVSRRSTVQVGFINKTNRIDGVQVGLLNCADNGVFQCMPFVNWGK